MGAQPKPPKKQKKDAPSRNRKQAKTKQSKAMRAKARHLHFVRNAKHAKSSERDKKAFVKMISKNGIYQKKRSKPQKPKEESHGPSTAQAPVRKKKAITTPPSPLAAIGRAAMHSKKALHKKTKKTKSLEKWHTKKVDGSVEDVWNPGSGGDSWADD